ncbi:MAG: MerR family transcriptional regulator [Candidatus Sericytochromatia bacterium]|nr:MerR family transcriptional regulator [Candidatus Sericytochromatia bacterium]
MPPSEPTHTLDALCLLADLPRRTVRYYIQLGLVDRPAGETRAARYGTRHLEQLLTIKKWAAAGLSLDRIRGLLAGEAPEVPAAAPRPGEVTVRSHILVDTGIELVLDPARAGLTPAQLRALSEGLTQLLTHVRREGATE